MSSAINDNLVMIALSSSRQSTTTLRWIACDVRHNMIMNGPTIGHTSSLFPFVDNDDGSAYFSIVGNVGVYGGA